jgi:hypothetical protein
MFRKRLAFVVLAASLSSGCANMFNHPWFGGSRDCCPYGYSCLEAGCPQGDTGPLLGDAGPNLLPPSMGLAPTAPTPIDPQATQLNPRLIPQPQAAQPYPYTPQSRLRFGKTTTMPQPMW